MKGSHSRLSHRPDKRYSNVAHVQGGMITDADLSEAGQIHQARDEALALTTIGSGIPAEGGMLHLGKEDVVFSNGAVVAEGKLGQFRLQKDQPMTLRDAIGSQVDLPFAPEMPEEAFVYVDLWERPVFAVEDPYLADVGLHGAETTYRTRTMVQLKSLPMRPGMRENLLKGVIRSHPAFRKTGDIRVHLAEISSSFRPVDCDPCADEISIDAEPPNALFRLEIISVTRDKDGAATGIQLAWSFENAEAIERIENAEALSRENHLYESLSVATESQMGFFPDPKELIDRKISPDLPEASGETPTEGVHRYTHARRWNGEVTVAMSGRQNPTGHNAQAVSFDNDMTVISTDYFRIFLDLEAREAFVGDYWLVELRRYAPEGERLRLNHGAFDAPSEPLGPVHHTLPLFPVRENTPFLPDDATRRRLSMPKLSNLPSTHIAYEPPENCELLKDTKTTKEALDRLCGLDASHVGFDGEGSNCDTLATSTNVEDALKRLCEADKKSQTQLMLRTMMDWGVAAGIRVLRNGNGLIIEPGVALDRTGLLHEVDRWDFDMTELTEKNVFGEQDLADIQEEHGEICLSLGFRGDEQQLFLSDPLLAYDIDDLTLKDQIEACLSTKSAKDQDLIDSRTLKEMLNDAAFDTRVVLTKMHIMFRRKFDLVNGFGLDRNEIGLAKDMLERLKKEIKEYLPVDMSDRLEETLVALSKQAAAPRRDGERLSQEQFDLLDMSQAYGAIINIDEEYRIKCVCDNLVPPMPETLGGFTLVPIAGIVLSRFRFGRMELERVCMTSCRKQSHNWRSFRYYFGDLIQNIFDVFDEICCEGRLGPDDAFRTLTGWLDDRHTAPWDGNAELPLWPAMPTYDNAPPSGENLDMDQLPDRGGWRYSDGPDALDIRGKDAETAQKELETAGFIVEQSVHIGSLQEALKKLGDTMPLLNRRPQKGDTVILLFDRTGAGRNIKTVAVEYVVIRQRRPFIPRRPIPFPRRPIGPGRFPNLDILRRNRVIKNVQVFEHRPVHPATDATRKDRPKGLAARRSDAVFRRDRARPAKVEETPPPRRAATKPKATRAAPKTTKRASAKPASTKSSATRAAPAAKKETKPRTRPRPAGTAKPATTSKATAAKPRAKPAQTKAKPRAATSKKTTTAKARPAKAVGRKAAVRKTTARKSTTRKPPTKGS